MESWIAKRPVLVSGHCDVTKNFCIESNGGLYYNDYDEFYYCVEYLLENKQIADTMGENGHKYVMSSFTNDIITKKYLRFIEDVIN
jgi:glycosyltransferase involved in cell wall biosynthesis